MWRSPASRCGCSPAAGWEKGQVEHQVQTIRGRFFQPRLRFASLEELNGWLEAECRRWAALHPHPDQRELTVAQAWDAERPSLQVMLAPFDGFHETPHAVTGTCLISFDRNRYSVMAKAARRAVQVRAYADRIVVRLDDEVIAEHPRFFGRDRMILDPWHYLPVLAKKPGALRNGAPFQDWDLPPALARLRRKLGTGDEADRRFVRVLSAVLTDGLEAVEAAIREALAAGAASDDVILNILARRREPPRPSTYHERVAQRRDPSRMSARARRDRVLKPEVLRVFAENFGVYGVRKVWRQMNREGLGVARCTVERLMRDLGLQGVIRGKPVKTTISDKAVPCPLDQVNRQFHALAPNMLWVSDFTYVATWTGFVYVAFVIDVYARYIVGWRVSRTAHASFVLDALEQAIHDRRPVHRGGLIHQSDRGSQYVSIKYTERLAEAGIEPSVGSVGDSYDYALAETINGLYKAEVIHRRGPWWSFEAVEYATLEWVDWFNNRRLLEPIGNIPPAEAEERYYAMLDDTLIAV